MSNEVIIGLSIYLVISFFFMLAIQFERVKNDLEITSIQIFVAPFWLPILIWYIAYNVSKKLKGRPRK